jgi:hypothetical protein
MEKLVRSQMALGYKRLEATSDVTLVRSSVSLEVLLKQNKIYVHGFLNGSSSFQFERIPYCKRGTGILALSYKF